MKAAQTVRGNVYGNDLGVTLVHTHLLVKPPEAWRPDPDYSIEDIEKVIEDVQEYADTGGKTMVEMTAIGQRKGMDDLCGISLSTGVNIIATTGFSWEPSMPEIAHHESEIEITKLMISEIETGIANTNVKAGVIKAGSSLNQITPTEMKIFRAAVNAHRETGTPITTHCTKGTAGLLQVEAFIDLGANIERVAIGHIDLSLQYGYIRYILNQGLNVIFDGIGKTKYYPDQRRAEIIAGLVDEGFVEKIMLACDYGRKTYFKSYGGGPGYAYAISDFIALLIAAGVPKKDIDIMLVQNPSRFFAFRD